MGWYAGCHHAKIRGNVKFYDGNNIFVLHLNKNFGAEYLIEKYRLLRERQSTNNQRRGYCVHYRRSPEDIRQMYKERLSRTLNFKELVE